MLIKHIILFSEENMENINFEYAAGTLLVSLSCEIDHHSAVSVRERIDERLRCERPRTLVFDLSNVSFMDSSGLGLILGRYTKAKAMGASVIIKNPPERVDKIFRMAGTDKLIKIVFDNKENNDETDK